MKSIFSLLLISSLWFLTSCQFFKASNTGQGTTYQYGKMEGYIEAPLQKVHIATDKAVKSLELLKVSDTKDALFSRYEVKNAKGDSITIDIEKLSSKSVKVFIKVGLIGDQVYSQAIFDAIKENL